MNAAPYDWLRSATVETAVYTPGDLERISGLGADMQRVWRRRGQLPSFGSAHARFSIEQVVEITLRAALSRKGVPPGTLGLDLSAATSGAMFHAVFCHGGAEAIGPTNEVERFLETFEKDRGQLGSFLVGNPERSNYLALNDHGKLRIVDDREQLITDDEEDVIVFNLAQLGARLVERGRKPVVTVRFPADKGGRMIRRLTGLTVDR